MASKDEVRRQLYAVGDMLDKGVEIELGLFLPIKTYLQDPQVAKQDPQFGFSTFNVKWEPGLRDGPTSARFAVVDYNGDTGTFVPPAQWDREKSEFTYGGAKLDEKRVDEFQFHQLSVWAHLQNALLFFEEGSGMGRRIPWAFEGNRLIVVPHAGYGQNAFYDRQSKSLQFYYYEFEDNPVYTCLSTDIVNHEFGHAVLDGVRPYFAETLSIESAAFHEFMGDISAVLLILRNNDFRNRLAALYPGGLSEARELEFLAEQFGQTVQDREFLRNAASQETMESVNNHPDPHFVSQVLTGAMYDILVKFSEHYLTVRKESPKQAFWHSVDRMQRVVVQPLDLLPPVDVTFRDYALAVLRTEELSNPTDPENYRDLLLDVFLKRGILGPQEVDSLRPRHRLYDRFDVDVFHSIETISQSRAGAYRFLDDNRRVLFIPSNEDFVVADLYEVNKYSEVAHRLPRQYVLEYVWREDVRLEGGEFGALSGHIVTMLCGGTLVFDERGNILSHFQKPGSHLDRTQKPTKASKAAAEAGKLRLEQFKANIAHNVRIGQIGINQESALGLLGIRMAPFITQTVNGTIRFEFSPHLNITESGMGGDRAWQISS